MQTKAVLIQALE